MSEVDHPSTVNEIMKSLLNKKPPVPRVPKCSSAFRVDECPSAWEAKYPSALSTRVSKCPSSAQVPRVPKCPSAFRLHEFPSAWEAKCPSSAWVPQVFKCLSLLSARVPEWASARMSECPSALPVPECLECLECLMCSSALRVQVPQEVS